MMLAASCTCTLSHHNRGERQIMPRYQRYGTPHRARALAMQNPSGTLMTACAGRVVVELSEQYLGQIPDEALSSVVETFTAHLLHALDALHMPAAEPEDC